MEALCKSGSLFEVTVPDYKQLKACHKEVLLLKELWDMIVLVSGRAPRAGWGQASARWGPPVALSCGDATAGFLVSDGSPQTPPRMGRC